MVNAAAVAVAVVLMSGGCGPRRPTTVPVRGTVMLNGRPLEGATILFQPEAGTPGRAVTSSDGSFTLTTFEEGDGALVGRHRVAVKKFTMSGLSEVGGVTGPVAAGEVKEQWVTPRKYATPATSGLEVEVGPGMEAVRLDLESR
jgi:hypothetical protein